MHIGLLILVFLVKTLAVTGQEDKDIDCRSRFQGISSVLCSVIQKKRSALETGLPELGLPSLDPFHIKVYKETIDKTYGKFTIQFENAFLTGLSTFKINDVNLEYSLKTVLLEMRLGFDHLFLDTQFNITGKILLIDFDSYGHATFNFTSMALMVSVTLTADDTRDRFNLTELHIDMLYDRYIAEFCTESGWMGALPTGLFNLAVAALNFEISVSKFLDGSKGIVEARLQEALDKVPIADIGIKIGGMLTQH